MNLSPPPKHSFVLLDALRGAAALCVVVFHYTGRLYNHTLDWPPSAFLAVDFFFLLSGFVIMHAYAARLQSGLLPTQFIIWRLIRLYPLYFLGTTIPIAASLLTDTPALPPLSYFLSLAFLPTPPQYVDVTKIFGLFPHNSPSWTLSLEIGINLVFALICMHMTTRRWRYLVVVAGFCLLGAFWQFHDASLGWSWQSYWCGVARILFSFFAGVLLYNYYQTRQPEPIAAAWGIALVALLFITLNMPHSSLGYAVIACFLFFPLIVWYGARVAVPASMTGFCRWVGRLSYVLYITHDPLLDVFISVATRMKINFYPHPRMTSCAFTICAIVAASFLDRFYDVPIRTYLAQKFRTQHVG